MVEGALRTLQARDDCRWQLPVPLQPGRMVLSRDGRGPVLGRVAERSASCKNALIAAHSSVRPEAWASHQPAKPRLLLRLAPNAAVWIFLVQQTGARLDQHSIRAAVHVRGKPELASNEKLGAASSDTITPGLVVQADAPRSRTCELERLGLRILRAR